jgi:hypothetical protein
MEGLWTVEFGSTIGGFGAGVVVFHEGRVMGGDNGYFYLGAYALNGNELRATIDVVPFIKGIESVFSTLGRNLRLELEGTVTSPGQAIAQGHPAEMPLLKIGVKLTKRS